MDQKKSNSAEGMEVTGTETREESEKNKVAEKAQARFIEPHYVMNPLFDDLPEPEQVSKHRKPLPELKINSEFECLKSPLTTLENELLEKSMIDQKGCGDRIRVWRGAIVDGVSRWKICKKTKLHEECKRCKTEELEFKDNREAIQWIIDNQMGRRSLLPNYRRYFLGLQYNKVKKPRGGNRTVREESNGQNVQSTSDGPAEKLAKLHGVNEKTVRRAGKYAEVIDALTDALGSPLGFDAKRDILSGKIKIRETHIRRILKLPQEDLAVVRERLKDAKIADLAAYLGNENHRNKSKKNRSALPLVTKDIEKLHEHIAGLALSEDLRQAFAQIKELSDSIEKRIVDSEGKHLAVVPVPEDQAQSVTGAA